MGGTLCAKVAHVCCGSSQITGKAGGAASVRVGPKVAAIVLIVRQVERAKIEVLSDGVVINFTGCICAKAITIGVNLAVNVGLFVPSLVIANGDASIGIGSRFL